MDDLIAFFIDDENYHPMNFNLMDHVLNELAQPLDVVDNENRGVVPRNEGFYEVTIPLYVGDLFKEHFRMSRPAFQELLQILGNAIEGIHKIPLEKKLLFAIWILAKPESFLAGGDRFGLSRSTAHVVFREIIGVLRNRMEDFINWPNNYELIEQEFNERYHFPGVVGAVDGCHIEIKQPTENAHDYYNRNNYHSIILQGLCDHRMNFIDIYVGAPGRVHDARVFRNSPAHNRINQMPQNFHILGDSAYPLSLNLMTPFRDNGHLNQIETNYNIRHSAARAVIERAFGRLKGKFRRLKYLDICSPDFGTEIIGAACVLHNFIIIEDGEDDEDFEAEEGIDNEYDGNEHNPNRHLAVIKRNEIAEILL